MLAGAGSSDPCGHFLGVPWMQRFHGGPEPRTRSACSLQSGFLPWAFTSVVLGWHEPTRLAYCMAALLVPSLPPIMVTVRIMAKQRLT